MTRIKILSLLILFMAQSLSWGNETNTSKKSTLSSDNLKYEQSSILAYPEKNTEEYFESKLKQRKYPLKLDWSVIEGADFYEVEITRSRNCSRRYFKTSKSGLDIMIFPNARYLWRVMAYSKNDILTEYSPKYKIYLKSPPGSHLVYMPEPSYTEESTRQLASSDNESACNYPSVEALSLNVPSEKEPEPQKELTNITKKISEEEPVALATPVNDETSLERTPAYSYANKYSLWGRSWIKGGMSFNGYFYNQEILDGNEVKHETISSPAYYAEFGNFFSPYFGITINANYTNGEFEDSGSLIDKDYTTQRITVEGIYLLGSDWKTTKRSQWHLKFGVGYNLAPMIEISSASNGFDLISSKIISARFGVGYKHKLTNNFRPELGLSVAYPVSLSTNSNSVDIDSGLSVDFSAAINYQLYDNYQIGLFWQSEMTSLEYTQNDSFTNATGDVFTINNHLGVYLGLEF